MPIIRIQNLNGGDDFNYINGEVEDRYLVRDGDLLFGWSGNRGTSFGPFRWKSPVVCALNQHIFRVVPKGVEKDALYWILKAVTAHVEDQAHGIIGMVHVTKGDLGSIKIPVPPPAEARAIAAFLDRETAKLDALVAEQRRLIELLKEKREAVISHAVTKGLNPTAKKKPSGIDWLGDIPEHWTCAQLTRVAERILVGIAEAATYAYVDEGIPILRSTNVRPGALVGEILYVNEEYAEGRATKRIEAGDLVTVRTGNAGVTAVIPPALDGCQCFTMLITTLSKGSSPEYYCYWMNSLAAQAYFKLEGWGTAQVNISVPILKELPVAMPPYHEQLEVVTYLKTQTAKLDALVDEARIAISLLNERRAALIAAAVTGQIDVRQAGELVPA
jgi:type I restriction enzyme S subunit